MGTWIKETDTAIYLMEEGFYLEKLIKIASGSNEKKLVITAMKRWFSRPDSPGTMIFGQGEPQAKPMDDHPGTGSGENAVKPEVEFIAANSTNFRARRSGFDISRIVMHNTVFSAQSAINHFKSPGVQVSAHYIVKRTGEIVQMVRDSDCAFHAGNRDINDSSIGIEHEATQTEQGLTEFQKKATVSLIKFLMEAYDIPLNKITPHREHKSTSCPSLIWSTNQSLEDWKRTNLT